MAQDPWEQAAKEYKGGAQVNTGTSSADVPKAAPTQAPDPQREGRVDLPDGGQVKTTDAALDPWAATDAPTERFSTQLMKEIPGAFADIGKGALKGAGQTLNGLGKIVVPDAAVRYFGGHVPTDEEEQNVFGAKNTLQSLGKGAEQAGEFLVPGLGEEAAVSKLGKLAPIGRMGYQALTSGAINKLQGGGFGTGALAGGIAGGIGEGFKAAAPALAESALDVGKIDRAYQKRPGESILKETTGVSPGAVSRSAQERIGQLTPQLEAAADAASIKPAPRIAGLLQAPQRAVPLSNAISRGSTRGGLFPAEESSVLIRDEGHGITANPGEQIVPRIDPYGVPNPAYVSGSEHPELAGRYAPSKGVLLSRGANVGARPEVDEFGRVVTPEPPTSVPFDYNQNRIASLAPARGVVSNAAGKAARQGEATTTGQLNPMADFLTANPVTGATHPEFITPRDLLDVKRGFGNEFIHNWKPETMHGVKGTASSTYHALDSELDRTVPGAADINQRISSLIPVVNRGESAERAASTTQRVLGRVGRATGALAGAVGGAVEGNRAGGLPGAVVGGLGGLVLPELLASPTVQMAGARALASPISGYGVKGIAGSALQFDRKSKKDENAR